MHEIKSLFLKCLALSAGALLGALFISMTVGAMSVAKAGTFAQSGDALVVVEAGRLDLNLHSADLGSDCQACSNLDHSADMSSPAKIPNVNLLDPGDEQSDDDQAEAAKVAVADKWEKRTGVSLTVTIV